MDLSSKRYSEIINKSLYSFLMLFIDIDYHNNIRFKVNTKFVEILYHQLQINFNHNYDVKFHHIHVFIFLQTLFFI